MSSAESTAFDLVGYLEHVGGLDAAATVLSELAERLDPEKLAEVAALAPLRWAQRLGHLLDGVGASDHTTALAEYVQQRAREYVALEPSLPSDSCKRDKKWRILVNIDVEPEA